MRKIILLLFTVVSSLGSAQVADMRDHWKMADSIRTFFNAQKFKEIYKRTSPGFKAEISEADVVDLLEKNLYGPLGLIEKLSYLRHQDEYYTYLLAFKEASLQMNLGYDRKSGITYFQLLPYKEEPAMVKREHYNSDNKLASHLDSIVDKAVRSFMQEPANCGLSIGVNYKGALHYYNYGETYRRSGALPTQNSIYDIGSITKTFCGILLGHAVAENKIALDDDIRKYLPGKYPDLQYGKSVIRIQHLANHTSGLPRIPSDLMSLGFDSLNPYAHYDKNRMYEFLRHTKPVTEPGKVCEYSNYGMALLGLILESVYNKNFSELVKEKITMPNGMSNTGIALTWEQTGRKVEGYNTSGQQTKGWEMGDFSAAGALKSSAGDMLKYLAYNRAEKDAASTLSHVITFSGRPQVGLAWFIKNMKPGNTLVWHNGGTFGFASFCGYLKEKDCALVVLANSGNEVDAVAINILDLLQQ